MAKLPQNMRLQQRVSDIIRTRGRAQLPGTAHTLTPERFHLSLYRYFARTPQAHREGPKYTSIS